MAVSNVLGRAAASASYNMLLQLQVRVLTFILNAFVLRYISRDLLGVVNVRLNLLYSTIVFVSREAFRRACMSKQTEDRNWVKIMNLVWCIVPIGFVTSVIFGYIWMNLLEQPDPDVVPHYHMGVLCFAASAFLELLEEPLYIAAQILLYVRLKVVAESVAIALRCVVTVAVVVFFPQYGVLGFGLAQVLFSLMIVVTYYGYFTFLVKRNTIEDFPFRSVRDFLPKQVQPPVSYGLASLTWSFFKQGFLKQLLTEGERFVMTIFDVLSFGDQGIYDVINNLGSLVARFVFLSLEDGGYLFFTQTLARGEPAERQDQEAMRLSTRVLESLLKVVSLIGFTVLTFGYAYAFLFLDLYGGSLLSSGSGPPLLRWYCMYILLLAVNGITECFTNATMSKTQLDRFNHKMLFFSFLFLSSSLIFTKYFGSIGFVLANCVNMTARIIHSLYHIHNYYRGTEERPLGSIIPSLPVVIILLSSFVLTSTSEYLFCCSKGVLYRLVHLGGGVFCGITLLVTIYVSEKKLVSFVQEQLRTRYRDTKTKDE